MQLGYYTDESEPDINYDTKNGSEWTRSVQVSELGDMSGYRLLSLDANQEGKPLSDKNNILITNLHIYIGGPELQIPETSGDPDPTDGTLAGYKAAWTLDNATNGDVTIDLSASICDSSGQCGSGHGDLGVYVEWADIKAGLAAAGITMTGDSDFVLHTEYLEANDGYEEWRFASAPRQVPEPTTLSLLGLGLLGLGFSRRRARK